MRLPNGEQAIIDPRKVLDYCLNPEHDDGKHKARLFRELLGVGLETADLLLIALKEAAARSDARSGRSDEYGQRYAVEFDFVGPKGEARVRSVWILLTGESVPRLVTCYVL